MDVMATSGQISPAHNRRVNKKGVFFRNCRKDKGRAWRKMSEQENRLAECKRLVLAFIAMSPDTENASPCVAKGGVLSKSGAAKDSDHEREKRENGDGAANSELLKLINEYQPPASSSGNSLVPDTLPRELKDRLLQLQREDFVEAFKVEAALEKVEKGVVSRRELICMYLKSFRNIFTYDLDELRDHTQVCERIVGYFSYVLQDVIESLYPTPREPWSVEKLLLDEFRCATQMRSNGALSQ